MCALKFKYTAEILIWKIRVVQNIWKISWLNNRDELTIDGNVRQATPSLCSCKVKIKKKKNAM